MVKLTVELPDDLAAWLANAAVTRRCSRQDLVVEMMRDAFEQAVASEALAAKAVREHQELLRRPASGPGDPNLELVGPILRKRRRTAVSRVIHSLKTSPWQLWTNL
ncbi:hypothetical protein [Glycomyces tritici]|uniref:Ribbon-helix-helix protein CopG domain-containing protein n=1 Tax=Glycomyces tritici TaxID=2665176 RepID=A0ABT7YJY0_9ACTN|nr:hypothetical protein [Glycomyces tritici]MDN3238947.1 hypothetical protein [Glycomyces tritici]